MINFIVTSFNSQLCSFCPELWVSQISSNYRFGIISHLLALIWDELNIFFYRSKNKSTVGSIPHDRHFNIQADGTFGLCIQSFYLYVPLKWWVCSEFFLYQSCIPHVTSVREGPAGGIKHHHLTSTHRHPELTCNNKKTTTHTHTDMHFISYFSVPYHKPNCLCLLF